VVGNELVRPREVRLGGVAVASVPGSLSQESLGLGRRLRRAHREKRITGFVERLGTSVVAGEVERTRPPEEEIGSSSGHRAGASSY
jgi:hypothetical protein